MFKFINRITLIILLFFGFLGCSSTHKKTEQQIATLEWQSKFYDEEAKSYADHGNEIMASYFSEKAEKTREQQYSSDYKLLNFVFDIILRE